MASLHSALESLGPVSFADVPTSTEELNQYIAGLCSNAQLVLESIPVQDTLSGEIIQLRVATRTSEVAPATACSPAPASESAKLREEWGQPLKLSSKGNALGLSLYNMPSRDNKGVWWARRSIHKGLSFNQFRKAMEMEFEQSVSVKGPPGAGAVRGVGGEDRYVSIDVPGRGKLEVYRLSAQFPGPTAPRDFVTMLVTSDKALQTSKKDHLIPRHYMTISKPCDHPQTQPQGGFVRGRYESIEFIREMSGKLEERESHVAYDQDSLITQAAPAMPNDPPHNEVDCDQNSIEWIMVTRSDPGGAVPRFIVERATPGGICTDVAKFLDWACSHHFETDAVEFGISSKSPRCHSAEETIWQGNSPNNSSETYKTTENYSTANKQAVQRPTSPVEQTIGGTTRVLSPAAASLSSYQPQAIPNNQSTHTTTTSATRAEMFQSQDMGVLIHPIVPGSTSDAISVVSSPSTYSTANEDLRPSSDAPRPLLDGSPVISSKHNKTDTTSPVALPGGDLMTSTDPELRDCINTATFEHEGKGQVSQGATISKREKAMRKHEEKYDKKHRRLIEKWEKGRMKLEQKFKTEHAEDGLNESIESKRGVKLGVEARKEIALLKALVEDLRKQNSMLVEQVRGGGRRDRQTLNQ